MRGRLFNKVIDAWICGIWSFFFIASAVTLAEEPLPLMERITDDHAQGVDLWIYNNLPAAKKKAQELNRPLFVTFRCVPCKDCAGFDAEVAQGSQEIADFADKNFVSIRQVEMKAVDLNQFEFDYDLNWAAMFINADGTVYARYGTQSAEGADAYNSIAGLKATMQRVLELHENYPDNREQFVGKRSSDRAVKLALELPGMKNQATLEGLTTRQNCIHCHMIHDAQHRAWHEEGTLTHDRLWRYPLPQNVGLNIVRDDGIEIESVEPDSPAEQAGLKPGEDIVRMNGQAMASIADMQWVLDDLPNTDTTLNVVGSETGEHTLQLAAGWKVTNPSWRGSLFTVSPVLHLWGPPAPPAVRAESGVLKGQGVFRIQYINRNQPSGKAAYNAGLREDDILVALDGEPLPESHAEWQLEIKLHHKVGDVVVFGVIRDGKRLDLEVPLVE